MVSSKCQQLRAGKKRKTTERWVSSCTQTSAWLSTLTWCSFIQTNCQPLDRSSTLHASAHPDARKYMTLEREPQTLTNSCFYNHKSILLWFEHFVKLIKKISRRVYQKTESNSIINGICTWPEFKLDTKPMEILHYTLSSSYMLQTVNTGRYSFIQKCWLMDDSLKY